MPRYRLTIAYDGTGFCGWQKQEPVPAPAEGAAPFSRSTPMMESDRPDRVALRTVQGVLEQAVRWVTREPVELIGASRTDSGVHAKGQVAAFTCEPRHAEHDAPAEAPATDAAATSAGVNNADPGHTTPTPDTPLTPEPHAPLPRHRPSGWPISRGTDRLRAAINSRLPDDVVVLEAEHAANDFDPIAHASSKEYTYTFHVSPLRPLWGRQRVHHIWHPSGLDARAMHEAAQVLVGEHDFASFASVGHGRLTTIRTIHALSVTRHETADEPGERVVIRISGSGFLWNMVRIIGGTLMEVGMGRRGPAEVKSALEARHRSAAGPTLPPTGLCLEWIKYPS